MKIDNNFFFHFRNSDIPFVVLELAFSKSGYGCFDYVVLYKNNLAEVYLSRKGIKQTKKFGLKMMSIFPSKYREITRFIDKLKKYKYSSWDELKGIFREFGKYYRYCEQPMLAGIENILYKNKVNIEECLRKGNKCNLNKECKKALNILEKLGKAKYNIHITSERPMRDIIKIAKGLRSGFYLREKEIDFYLKNQTVKGIKRDRLVIIGDTVRFDYNVWRKKICSRHKRSKKITGVGVSGGIIRGKVKIFMSSIESTFIPANSVVVSGMTNPQIVPYLNNASAIVTDEGGLMCHAAIVARELKIPCVVGTKIATQVLKDGDIVEVDADKGVVRIIK